MSDNLPQQKPKLYVNEIKDTFLRENFKRLEEYFRTQNQIGDFHHFEIEFDGPEDNRVVRHPLAYVPRDVIVTKIVGSGGATFNFKDFTDEEISISSSGKIKIRFYVGSYFAGNASKTDDSIEDTMFVSANESASAVISEGVPTGTVLPWPGAKENIPPGYLYCGGATFSRTGLPALFSVIGTRHGAGNGSNTANLPDYRGLSLRGVDDGSGRDPDATARTAMNPGGATGDNSGSVQDDATALPTTPFGTAGGDHTHTLPRSTAPWAAAGSSLTNLSTFSSVNDVSSGAGSHAHTITGGDNETRGKNASAYWIIKT